jgi:DNA modification methylase
LKEGSAWQHEHLALLKREHKIMSQLALPLNTASQYRQDQSYVEKLVSILSEDLNFQDDKGEHLSHRLHSFPAKFPPQLPRKFITELTQDGDAVLDPMMGSGTTILEAYLEGRQAIGFDIDPLAQLLCRVKVRSFNKSDIQSLGDDIVSRAKKALKQSPGRLKTKLEKRFDEKTLEFIDYWFAAETQPELFALLNEIESIENGEAKEFFRLVFSSIIITKSGGVSLALDLAHTRPHMAKTIISTSGEILLGERAANGADSKAKILTKILRSPLLEFEKRLRQNLRGGLENLRPSIAPAIAYGDAQMLPLGNDSVDLIVTSPPYASNAIDYMRAHKFSLVWLGMPIDSLKEKRKKYIGGEGALQLPFMRLPKSVSTIVDKVSEKGKSKGRALQRYYSEMTIALKEMFRVLKLGKAAIVVVGNSTLAGHDTQTQNCLADIGKQIGFLVPKIGVRQLDRNKRMLPAGSSVNRSSQIQQRMYEEYVIGFYKPD